MSKIPVESSGEDQTTIPQSGALLRFNHQTIQEPADKEDGFIAKF